MNRSSQLVSGQFEKHLYLLDGSNIACFYGKKNADHTLIITAVTSILEHDKKAEIFVVVDATLRHQVRDKQGFEEMLSRSFIHQAPAGTTADYFIKNIAESFGSRIKVIIVSNDLYRKLGMEGFFRVKFMFYNIAERTGVIFYPDFAELNQAWD